MGIYIYDDTIPLNFEGLELRERHGYTEAVCHGCGSWVRISEFYKGDRIVIRAIPHIPRCYHYENLFIKEDK